MKDIVFIKGLLSICILILTLMFIFPPWETCVKRDVVATSVAGGRYDDYERDYYYIINRKEHSGYHFIFSNPQPTYRGRDLNIDESHIGSVRDFASITINLKRLFIPAIPVFLYIIILLYKLFLFTKYDQNNVNGTSTKRCDHTDIDST